MSTRVGFDVGPLQGRRTGIGHAVAALADALAERPDVELLPYLLSARARPDATTRRLPLPAALAHRLWGRIDHPRVDRWLGGPELIHGTNYVVPPSRLPRLVSVYDCWFLLHPDQAHPAVVRAGAVLERALATGAVVHCSSAATAAAIGRLFPGIESHTVHLGALALPPPADRCPIPELDGPEFVVSVATLERRKNLPRLVSAFGLLAAERPELRLVLAGGDGDDRAAIDRAIDQLHPHAGSRVLLTGFVDDGTRSWLVHHARVVAYPSLDEGFGFPLLDAMHARVPIVASSAGSIPELTGDAALLVPAADHVAFAEALRQALDDDALRARMVAAGTAQVQQFTWQHTAEGMAALYHRLVERRP
jgi:glycosyltransferase involved in cell wall biosynthesis